MRLSGTIKQLIRRGRDVGRDVYEAVQAARNHSATPVSSAPKAPVPEPVPVTPAEPDDGRVRLTYKERTVVFEPFGGSIERILRNGSFYEAAFLQYIESLQRSGVYIDAGAYVGTHSLFFALFCPSTKVYSFEPRQHCFDLLQKNIIANGVADRVVLNKVGLSDRDETVTVSLDRRDEVFKCSSLDKIVVDECVAIIKIDVEGMEPKVLAGARKILERDRPVVFLEAQNDEELTKNKELMSTLGYEATGKVFNATPTYEFVAVER